MKNSDMNYATDFRYLPKSAASQGLNTSSVLPVIRKRDDLNRPFSLCGRRCYLIGFQNGLFPNYGWHIVGEMSGIWTHPIKIADGFWIGIESIDEGRYGYRRSMRRWLRECDEFVLGAGGAWVEHHYKLADFLVVRREFIPYEKPAVGIEVQVTSRERSIKTVQLNFLTRFHILPVWFSGWPEPESLEAEVRDDMLIVHGISSYSLPASYGRWTAALGCDTSPRSIAIGESLSGPEQFHSNRGVSCLLKFHLSLNPSTRIRLVLAGDHEGEMGAINTVKEILQGYDLELQRKVGRYNYIASQTTVLQTPERLLNDAFLWSKLNLEWLTQSSPYVGTGVVAGHQDYPWYFGIDTALSIGGLLAAGLHDTAKQSLRLLANVGKKQNGRIPHEILTNGVVYDRGRIIETALFVQAVWNTYLWTGDEVFLKEMYPICRMGILDYVLKQPRKDGILLTETKDIRDSPRDKLCPAFVVLGLKAMARMAKRVGDDDAFKEARSEAEAMRRQIEELFWVEKEGLYASLLDERNKPVVHGVGGFQFFQKGSLEVAFCGIADKDRIQRALSKIEGATYTSDWGVYLTSNRDISMPITTGIAAIGEFNYGRLEEGLRFIRMIAKSVGHIMPGAVPEAVHPSGDPKRFDPNWCYLQLWSAAILIHGLIWGLLHIEPDAAKKKVTINPSLPKDWPYAEVKNIMVGRSKFNVRLEREKVEIIQTSGPKLEILLRKKEEI